MGGQLVPFPQTSPTSRASEGTQRLPARRWSYVYCKSHGLPKVTRRTMSTGGFFSLSPPLHHNTATGEELRLPGSNPVSLFCPGRMEPNENRSKYKQEVDREENIAANTTNLREGPKLHRSVPEANTTAAENLSRSTMRRTHSARIQRSVPGPDTGAAGSTLKQRLSARFQRSVPEPNTTAAAVKFSARLSRSVPDPNTTAAGKEPATATKLPNETGTISACREKEEVDQRAEEPAGPGEQKKRKNKNWFQAFFTKTRDKPNVDQVEQSNDQRELKTVLHNLRPVLHFKEFKIAEAVVNDYEKGNLPCENATNLLTLLQYYAKHQPQQPGEDLHWKKKGDQKQKLLVKSASIWISCTVTGETFGAHQRLLDQVKHLKGLNVVECPQWQNCQVIIVFCVIDSRVGSNVEAAMSKTPDGKPVILVLMHHTRDVYYSTGGRKWSDSFDKVVLDVHVLYHQTRQGLLTCPKNQQAVKHIQEVLQRYTKKEKWLQL
ncbi:uncharacterized protein LOC142988942 isoform X2 [Genypterus blacodes]|uniref:uncharacterized protein LOC142988942 isoform X2 n=1 Tax=Genypterus blacodes TaxID=154954 RepID=UPI003F777E2B